MKLLASLLERRPALGYFGGLLAAMPPWVSDLELWLKLIGALVGIVVGLLTAAIQARTWWRGRNS